MSKHRMLSKEITNSARFLKLSLTSQALYFHLCLNADDDGVVEGFTVVRMIGANEDDLKLLCAKGLVTLLNDDYVAFVNDWLVHNRIRPDRKRDSVYQKLLISVLPDVELVQTKESYYSRAKSICPTNAGQVAVKCQTFDRPKIREGKTSKEKFTSSSGFAISLKDEGVYEIPAGKLQAWKEVYPLIDVEVELRKMALWSESNPAKRKSKRGVERFIVGWLNRADKEAKGSGAQGGSEGEAEDWQPPEYYKAPREPRADDPFQ